jgi:DNA helicase II / ATP-dependent DNA helicase PcrA
MGERRECLTKQQMVDVVIERVCRKRTPGPCQGEFGKSYCKGIGKCPIAEKSEKQLDYVLSCNTQNTFLQACPGSGKTEVVGLKAAYEFFEWSPKNSGIAILTFTNNASDVIRDRVQLYAGIEKGSYPHFIGTLDSWLHRYVGHPFGYLITNYAGLQKEGKRDKSIKLADENISEGWINNYPCKTGYCYLPRSNAVPYAISPLYANMLRYDSERDGWEIKIPGSSEYQTDEVHFSSDAFRAFRVSNSWMRIEHMRKSFSDAKKKFLCEGFATYHDVEWICYQLLKEKVVFARRLSQRFPFIIIDECQDLSWVQLQILELLKNNGTILHFVGDLNQAIWEYRKVDPEKVESFTKQCNFERRKLEENFRSCQPIVDLFSRLVPCSDTVGKEVPSKGPACVCFTYKSEEQLSDVPKQFESYLAKRGGLSIDGSAILTRGKTTMYKLQSLSTEQRGKPQARLSMAIHLWSTNSFRFRDDALINLGHFVSACYFKGDCSSSRSHYCPESVESHIRWRLFLAAILDNCIKPDCEIGDLSRSWSNWASSVRKHLDEIVLSCLPCLQCTIQIDVVKGTRAFKAPRGFAGTPVLSTVAVGDKNSFNVKISTIHGAKGKTFESILLVSSPNRQGGTGGHWTEWLADKHNEHARFAYVACSRPKKLLAWAIPETDVNEVAMKIINKLGFIFEDLPVHHNKIDQGENGI